MHSIFVQLTVLTKHIQ